jgi:parallel beta-helix repeat protein
MLPGKRSSVLALAAGAVLAFPAVSVAHDIDVFPGESIQRAVIQAHHGDVIRVHRGTYHQVVEIKKNGLTLKGAGSQKPHRTLIKPPKRSDRCQGGSSGVCVLPHPRGGHSVATQGTQIKGFMIRGFEAFGAVAFNAKHTIFRQDKFANNGEYGVAAFASTRTKFLHNLATGSGEAGFYVGDSKRARAVLRGNRARDNGEFGFFLRDSSHGRVLRNTAEGNCLGIGLINTGSSGGVRGWRVRDNDAIRNNRFCKGTEGGPPISGTGIALLGAKKNQIHDNVVLSNRPSKPAPFGGGIVVVSSKPLGGTLAAQNIIKRNSALKNLPADIVWDRKGKGNRFRHNSCETSQPSGLCG